MMKKLAFFLALLMFCTALPFGIFAEDAAPAGPQVVVNGKLLVCDVPPRIVNDRMLLPLRAVLESLGATLSWEGKTRTILATLGTKSVVMVIGSMTATTIDYVSGGLPTQTKMDVAPEIYNDRTLVPVRAISELFGMTVEWDAATQTATVTSGGAAPTETAPAETAPAEETAAE